ncbi:MAG: permease [Oscillospiraceae bacterium]|nr:permease [Oscillospiraceae bacterium]
MDLKRWIEFLSVPYFLERCWLTLIGIAPYLIAGVLIGELLKFTSWTKIIYKWTSKSPFVALIAASIIGTVSPLCTYGTIPVVIELYKSGAHIAPLVTFLAASSLMNPQLFVMTAGGIDDIGLEIAAVLVVCVIIVSLVLGLLIYLVPAKYIIKKNIVLYDDGGCDIINRSKKIFIIKQYLLNCLKNLKTIGFYLFIGIFLSVGIELYIPKTIIHNALGEQQGIRSVLFASLLGVPLYACGGGAIPLVDRLIKNGMAKGSGLAFFIVGSATRPAPLAAMAVLFTPLFLAMYCVYLIAASVLMGLAYI